MPDSAARVFSERDDRWLGCGFGIALFGLAGAVSGIQIVMRHPFDIGSWTCPILAAVIGAWLVLVYVVSLAAHFVHERRPDRLDVSDGRLRLRMWHRWSGLRQSFRRTDATVPLADLTGVVFSLSQGGLTQVFVRHRAGPKFYVGFTGPRARAEEHAAWILGWIGRT